MTHMTETPRAAPSIPPDADRRVGVEIELGGLSEQVVAQRLADWLDGTTAQIADHRHTVATARHGDWTVELDTAWRHEIAMTGDVGATLARQLIPVEIVTPPRPRRDLPVVTGLVARLSALGAKGSRSTLAGAYGVHFNPEELCPAQATVPILRAYAALEPWLRHVSDLDLTRRALPFIDPWPQGLIEALVAPDAARLELDGAAKLYLDHVTGRNHGLDMLPLLRDQCPDLVAARPDVDSGAARPAYHFRLPECRLDEDGWSLDHEWQKWAVVEAVARDASVLDRLTRAVSAGDNRVRAARSVLSPLLQEPRFACLAR